MNNQILINQKYNVKNDNMKNKLYKLLTIYIYQISNKYKLIIVYYFYIYQN